MAPTDILKTILHDGDSVFLKFASNSSLEENKSSGSSAATNHHDRALRSHGRFSETAFRKHTIQRPSQKQERAPVPELLKGGGNDSTRGGSGLPLQTAGASAVRGALAWEMRGASHSYIQLGEHTSIVGGKIASGIVPRGTLGTSPEVVRMSSRAQPVAGDSRVPAVDASGNGTVAGAGGGLGPAGNHGTEYDAADAVTSAAGVGYGTALGILSRDGDRDRGRGRGGAKKKMSGPESGKEDEDEDEDEDEVADELEASLRAATAPRGGLGHARAVATADLLGAARRSMATENAGFVGVGRVLGDAGMSISGTKGGAAQREARGGTGRVTFESQRVLAGGAPGSIPGSERSGIGPRVAGDTPDVTSVTNPTGSTSRATEKETHLSSSGLGNGASGSSSRNGSGIGSGLDLGGHSPRLVGGRSVPSGWDMKGRI